MATTDVSHPMTARGFRRMALSLPDAVESAHMEHPDFRVSGKIFATLGYPDAEHASVKLTPDQQFALVKALPDGFVPAPGAWGARGWTLISLAVATRDPIHDALVFAWRNTAPKKLLSRHPDLAQRLQANASH